MTTSIRIWNNRTLIYLRDLLHELVGRDLKLRYKRSVLGIIWSLISPLTQLLIFTFLFNKVVPLNIPNYTTFVFSGVLAWTWFQTSLLMGTTVIVDNRDLIRRPGFPAAVLPAVTVTTNLIHYVLALPVLLVFLLLDGGRITPAFLVLPLILVIQFLFTLSLVYIVAALHVTFRDVQHILGIALILLFYLTPVFYRANAVPEEYQMIYQLNPLAHLLDAYRTLLIMGQWPDPVPLALISGATVVLFGIGYNIFTRANDHFAEEL